VRQGDEDVSRRVFLDPQETKVAQRDTHETRPAAGGDEFEAGLDDRRLKVG